LSRYLKLKKPKNLFLVTYFHVLYVGVGKASGAVPFNLSSINNCMIRWGTVKSLSKKEAVVNLNSLKFKKTFCIFTHSNQNNNPFLIQNSAPDLKVEDTVAVHHGI